MLRARALTQLGLTWKGLGGRIQGTAFGLTIQCPQFPLFLERERGREMKEKEREEGKGKRE